MHRKKTSNKIIITSFVFLAEKRQIEIKGYTCYCQFVRSELVSGRISRLSIYPSTCTGEKIRTFSTRSSIGFRIPLLITYSVLS